MCGTTMIELRSSAIVMLIINLTLFFCNSNMLFTLASMPDLSQTMTWLQQYDSKICAGEDTCHLTTNSNLPSNKRNFPTRNCMCDIDCVNYDDCCQDAQFYQYSKYKISSKIYHCSPVYKVYMISNCPINFNNNDVVEKCNKGVQQATIPFMDIPMVYRVPVINIKSRLTYANEFCAICNGETKFIHLVSQIDCSVNTTLEGNKSNQRKQERIPFSNSPTNFRSQTIAHSTMNSERSSSNSIKGASPMSPFVKTSLPGICDCNEPERIHEQHQQNTEMPPSTSILSRSASTYNVPPKPYPYTSNRYPSVNSGDSYPNVNIHIHVYLPNHYNMGSGPYRSRRMTSDNGRKRIQNEDDQVDDGVQNTNTEELERSLRYDEKLDHYVANVNGVPRQCKFQMKVPRYFDPMTRNCVPNVISDCGVACEGPMNLKYDWTNNKVYKNMDCLICNRVDPSISNITSCPKLAGKGGSSLFNLSQKRDPKDRNPDDEVLVEKDNKFN